MDQFELYETFYNSIDDILQEVEFVQKGKNDYLTNVASVFDIEASSFYYNNEIKPENKRCCMYAWVFGINGKCIRGRTWQEFITVIDKIKDYYKCDLKNRFVIYVHNLSYEFQWIKHRFNWHKVFSLESHKPIYAITEEGIEFRCSYLLSGLSLAKLGEDLIKYKVKKLVGDLDYDLLRTSDTQLTDKEWGYILHDGLVVMAYIQEEIERVGSITEIPYTKTGYVRKLCREKCLKGEDRYNYSKLIKYLTMTPEDYTQLKRTYTGGFTHANHLHVDKECYKVSSYDFTSSYPAVMLSEKYPMSKAEYIEIKDKADFYNNLKKYCCMFEVKFYNIIAKVDFEHYISISRCNICEDYILDNGRVVEAKTLEISITEQDFFIIEQMYSWEKMTVGNFKRYHKDYLPKSLIKTILQLYRDKTTLKGVVGKEQEYLVSKGMINACYGMAVTDPCKDEILYDTENDWYSETNDLIKSIFNYNYSSSRFLYYPWGIWITAYARRNLFSGILECKNDYIYADTDSIKIFNRQLHEQYFIHYNNTIKLKIKKCLNYYNLPYILSEPKTIKGIAKPLGVWDYEGDYKRFKTLGAKRYMYEDENNNLHITISGVKKKNGVEYLKYKYHNNDNIFKHFTDNLEFPPIYKDKDEIKQGAGKLCHTYIDTYHSEEVIDYLGNHTSYCEFSGVHMEPTGYNLSLDVAFKNYLLGMKGNYLL